jgi:8-oxo-dGTP pyrophosphatase MutT (NUDIX family)
MLHLHDAVLKSAGEGLIAGRVVITDMCETLPNIENLGQGELLRRIAPYLAAAAPAIPAAVENPAAVLIPIVARRRPSVLFTLRPEEMSLHGGQICFPGGRFQHEDKDFLQTALRETEEETGISRDAIEIAGFLDPYGTVTGYTVIPVVGLLREEFLLRPNPTEVDEIFEAPLTHLLDPANHERRSLERDGMTREYYAIHYEERLIWGATAGMIVNFSKRLGER